MDLWSPVGHRLGLAVLWELCAPGIPEVSMVVWVVVKCTTQIVIFLVFSGNQERQGMDKLVRCLIFICSVFS